jgi:arylsulfatase A-like enzyme
LQWDKEIQIMEKRRSFLKKLGVGITAMQFPYQVLSEGENNSRPNLLFVFSDQHRNHALGLNGEDPVITPNIDHFAAEGTVMENAISSFSLCSPFRASLMTGKFPMSSGITTNTKPGLMMELGADEKCLGDIWKKAGYQTAYIGKWHLDAPELNLQNAKKASAVQTDGMPMYHPEQEGTVLTTGTPIMPLMIILTPITGGISPK